MEGAIWGDGGRDMTPDILMAIGRIAFGLFFVIAGLRNLAALNGRKPEPTNYGFALPVSLVVLGFVLQVAAGLGLVLDFHAAWASIALIGFLVAATGLFHNPLMFAKADRGLHLYLFLVNCTLAAGLVMIIGTLSAL